MLAPTGKLTVSLMLPDPDAVFPVAPPVPLLLYEQVSDAGKVSATATPGALLGPTLLAVIVYVTEPPGTAVVTPSVLVIPRSPCGARLSVSVAELFPAFVSAAAAGALTVAVFERVPVA